MSEAIVQDVERHGGQALAPLVSVVMPCLNEVDTVASCVDRAHAALATTNFPYEIIVADNGSTDGSIEAALRHGARVVNVVEKGYGSALMGGIDATRGTLIVMGDADASYDFAEIPSFLAVLCEGYELVQGCRLPTGGGSVLPGAMPFLHRWWGNPMFSALVRLWFQAPIHDLHCGMRAFTKDLYRRLNLHCTGMEFASEMVVKAVLQNARIAEVPITLHPDGRRERKPHLRTFRDGWRHLRFLLMYSPRWLFLIPGATLVMAGVIGYVIAMPRLQIRGITFDVHTLLFASLAIICGFQAIVFAILAKVFAVTEGLLPADARFAKLFTIFTLERGLVAGAVAVVVGCALLAAAINQWRLVGFGDLDYAQTMRLVIPGVMLTALGFQATLFSFFFSLLGLKRK